MIPIVEVSGLKKSYGSLEVLRNISFAVEEGEIFAILGPNGAGKTTCVEILEGYRDADAGKVSVMGFKPQSRSPQFKERIGIVIQTSGIENELTPREVLTLYGAAYKSPKPPMELLESVQLQEKADFKIGKLSGGQRRRLDLALGLVGNPDLIFLDEPTTGFSPEARRATWDMLSALKREGKTILLTSHYMEEVERLADRMVILLDGEIIREGKPEDLRQGNTLVDFVLPSGWEDLADWLNPNVQDGTIQKMEIAHTVRILTNCPTQILQQLTSRAVADGVELENLKVHLLDLEDVYLEAISQSTTSAPKHFADEYMGDG